MINDGVNSSPDNPTLEMELYESLRAADRRLLMIGVEMLTENTLPPWRVRDFELFVSQQIFLLGALATLMKLYAEQAPTKSLPKSVAVGRAYKLEQLKRFEKGSACESLEKSVSTWAEIWSVVIQMLELWPLPTLVEPSRGESRRQFNYHCGRIRRRDTQLQLARQTHIGIRDSWRKILRAYWAVVIVEPTVASSVSEIADGSAESGRENVKCKYIL